MLRCSEAQNVASKCNGRTATYRTLIGSQVYFQLQLLYGNQQRAVRKQKRAIICTCPLLHWIYKTGHISHAIQAALYIICLTEYFVHICTNKSDNPVLNYFKSKHSSMFMAGIFDYSNEKAPKKLSPPPRPKINQSVHFPIIYFLVLRIESFLLYILVNLFCPKP